MPSFCAVNAVRSPVRSPRARYWRPSLHCFRLVGRVMVAALFFGLTPQDLFSRDKLQSPSFTAVLEGTEQNVVEALENIVNDTEIHGTNVYDKDQTLGGAEAEKTSKAFADWAGGGRVYFKTAFNALSPRNFKDSEDQGTVTVRYVLNNEGPNRFRIQIDAVFVETARRTVHPSLGLVESSEFKEIAERLKAIQLQTQRDSNSRARIDAEIAAKEELLARRQAESTKLAAAEASAQDLVARMQELRHQVERRVGQAGAKVKSAPFEGAATLETLKQSTDVVVLILTPYWFGVETSDGHRGWIRKEQLEPLP
jgi:hypothetical protein